MQPSDGECVETRFVEAHQLAPWWMMWCLHVAPACCCWLNISTVVVFERYIKCDYEGCISIDHL